MRACIILCVEGRIVGAFEADRILIITVIRFIIAVEEHLGLINTAVQQTVDTTAARVMILTEFVDEILFVDIVEIVHAVMRTAEQRVDQLVVIE